MILNDKDYNRLIDAIRQLRVNAINNINIKTLAEELKNAEIIPAQKTPEDLITMNSKALITRLDNNQEIELSVVYHDDADMRNKRVSVFAPMGIALLGTKEKEVFNCLLPNGAVHYRVNKIVYQPEAAGDLAL